MANINYDKKDHQEWAKQRNNIQDKKWKSHALTPKKNKKSHIDLGIHEIHEWQPLRGPFGPHAGKIICNTCNGKWVAWLAKGSI